MGLLSKIFGGERDDMRDAGRIYAKVMQQSRQAQFFGPGKFPDNYDGRIDFLTFNLGLIMNRLRGFDQNGRLLSQALFDSLRDDFEVALREEGLSDKGVAKRIKPMIRLFYDRLKAYDGLSDKTGMSTVLAENIGLEFRTEFTDNVAQYGLSFSHHLNMLSLGEIANLKFDFPQLE